MVSYCSPPGSVMKVKNIISKNFWEEHMAVWSPEAMHNIKQMEPQAPCVGPAQPVITGMLIIIDITHVSIQNNNWHLHTTLAFQDALAWYQVSSSLQQTK